MTSSSGKNSEPKAIDVEVVPNAPPASREPASTFFHPLSGLAILAIDWLAFGLDWPTGFLLTALTSAGAFAATFAAVYWIQRRERSDSSQRAKWKAMIGAIAAGVPFPVTGTILGVGILFLSGLPLGGKAALFRTWSSKKRE